MAQEARRAPVNGVNGSLLEDESFLNAAAHRGGVVGRRGCAGGKALSDLLRWPRLQVDEDRRFRDLCDQQVCSFRCVAQIFEDISQLKSCHRVRQNP